MRSSVVQLSMAAVLVVLIAGCGTIPLGKADRATVFDAAVNNYRKLVRWGYYDEAAKYLRTPDGKPFAADLRNAARYRVTDYTVSNQLLSDDGKEGRVIASIDYYELDSGIIRSMHDEQKWWYDAEGKRWYLQSPLPQFGRREEEIAPGSVMPTPAKP